MVKLELTDEQYTALTMALVDARRYQQRRAVEVMKLVEDDTPSWNASCEEEAARHMVLAHRINEVREAVLDATRASRQKEAAPVSEAPGRQEESGAEEDPIRRVWMKAWNKLENQRSTSIRS